MAPKMAPQVPGPDPGRLPGRTNPQVRTGGGEGNRTHDLLHAMQALYQLSYAPRRPENNTSFDAAAKSV
jgi:hypothetical protein